MKINFREEKKKYWIINCILYNLLKPTKLFRDKNLWLFGAQVGTKYDDNAMYLFEYINNIDSSIRAVWLTRKDEIVQIVKRKGFEAYNVQTKQGKKIALKAGVVFYTGGLDDFGRFPLVGGATIVSLWHGVGFKKIYNETYQGIGLKLKKLMDCFFSWTVRNISIATSVYSKRKTIKQFNLKEKNVYITGQPRNDVFKIPIIPREEVLSGVTISDNRKILLYMPTYRWTSHNKESVSIILEKLVSNENLNKLLEEKGFILVTKLHYKTSVNNLTLNDNFIMLRDENVISNQKLLAISDGLITDYSSCFVDFALLNRPVLFFMPDMEEYMETAGGIDEEFFSMILNQNRADDIQKLCSFISDIDNPDMLKQNEAINSYFEDKSIVGKCYCENVYKLTMNLINSV